MKVILTSTLGLSKDEENELRSLSLGVDFVKSWWQEGKDDIAPDQKVELDLPPLLLKLMNIAGKVVIIQDKSNVIVEIYNDYRE